MQVALDKSVCQMHKCNLKLLQFLPTPNFWNTSLNFHQDCIYLIINTVKTVTYTHLYIFKK